MNLDTIVKPMERGQITLPQKLREKMGITKNTLLNVTIEEDKIVIIPLEKMFGDKSSLSIKPKIPKDKYLLLLKSFKGDLWSDEDEKARIKLRRKERFLNW